MKLSKQQRRLLTLVLALSMLVSVVFAAPAASAAKEVKQFSSGGVNYHYYEKDDGTVGLQYIQSADEGMLTVDEFAVPSKINGMTVSEIGGMCFGGLAAKKVIIPNTVTELFNAFYGAMQIEKVTIPASVTKVSDATFIFSNANMIVDIDPANTALSLKDGCLIRTEDNALLGYKGGQSKLTIPNGVVKIVPFAFGSSTISEVVVPQTVTDIEYDAFMNCGNLASIQLPSNLKSIEPSTFTGCSSLKSIDLPKTVSKIGRFAFSSCILLEEIEIPQSVSEIYQNAFSDCRSLKSAVMNEGLKKIGREAFFDCESLASVTIPSTIQKIGPYALGFVENNSWYDDDGDYDEFYKDDDLAFVGGGYVEPDPFEYGEDDDLIPSWYKKVDGFVIYGTSGTAAQTYADRYSFSFVASGAATVIRGDADGDGSVTVMDATRVQRWIAELCDMNGTAFTGAQLTEGEVLVTDADGDGDVTIMDATSIQRYVAELPTNNNIGKPIA